MCFITIISGVYVLFFRFCAGENRPELKLRLGVRPPIRNSKGKERGWRPKAKRKKAGSNQEERGEEAILKSAEKGDFLVSFCFEVPAAGSLLLAKQTGRMDLRNKTDFATCRCIIL